MVILLRGSSVGLIFMVSSWWVRVTYCSGKLYFASYFMVSWGKRKWAMIKVFVVRKFLVAFLRDPPESSMDAKNLRFGQIVGAVQVVVSCVCCLGSRKLVSKEFVMVGSSFVVYQWTWMEELKPL